MNLFVATPTMHNLVSAGFSKTIAAIGLVCKKHDIAWGYETADTSFIVDARNKLTERFLSRPERTHMLMIDSDSELGFAAVEKLLTCNYPFASLPFCMRQIDLQRFFETSRWSKDEALSFDNALASSLTWCVDLDTNDQQVVDGWVKARRTGFGCVLLERGLLEAVHRMDGPHWFDRIKDPEDMSNSKLLSEDMSFCARVRVIAKPMLCVDQVTHHNGTFSFGARLLDDQRYFRRSSDGQTPSQDHAAAEPRGQVRRGPPQMGG